MNNPGYIAVSPVSARRNAGPYHNALLSSRSMFCGGRMRVAAATIPARSNGSIRMMQSPSDGLLGDVYQRIWTADRTHSSGLRAITPNEERDTSTGYVIVNETDRRSDPGELFPGEPVIPESKARSYQLARALFDNYHFLDSRRETTDPNEMAEVDELLEYIVNSAPMQIAREFISESTGRTYSDNAWFARLKELWFQPFELRSGTPSRSGFEHVFLGESKDGRVGGLHWWYYYNHYESDIEYRGTSYGNVQGGATVPEIATMSFTWDVEGRTIFKRIGGFFVGPSVEGLMALGTVRAHDGAPTRAVIEGVEVELKMFKMNNGRSVNTFYPVLQRVLAFSPPASPPSVPSPAPAPVPESGQDGGMVRLIAAFTNPSGADQGRESVTLMNLAGPKVANLNGWVLVGPRGGEIVFGDMNLAPGEAYTFTLSARAGVALSNKGGEIQLRSPSGVVVQKLEYPSRVRQGEAVVWNGASRLVPTSTAISS